ncbi:Hypothetical protein Minf_2436 [Methylacidiphilum infernorum V4]|uniref:Uncharacterized protein n=1 Tax=Methylacidiphilum infernorum (isolate V4) TaxID=481448 RepID=B3E113_METI4|nr:Hypothetical protein Minf_2436 [Methylacidiphilum infernorum V4]
MLLSLLGSPIEPRGIGISFYFIYLLLAYSLDILGKGQAFGCFPLCLYCRKQGP